MGWGTVDAVFCNNCGHRNPEGVNFCSSCGNALLAEGDDATITLRPDRPRGQCRGAAPTSRPVEVPHGAGVLVVTRGPNIGARYLLVDPVVTGPVATPRATSFSTTSRCPAATSRSRRKDGGLPCADVGSLNGTYVNRERIDEVQLCPGDEVQIGKFKLVYLVAGNE